MKQSASEDVKTAIGQCFWIGINGTTIDDRHTRAIFRAFQPGGVILFQRNVESAAQIRELNDALQSLSTIPLLLAVDQEGGSVERLHEVIGSIPPAMALAATRNPSLTRNIHLVHARILRRLGFNVNFTPVLDLAVTAADNGLGTRCFSSNPRIVASYAREVILAHREAGVLPCGKHFPGLGDTDLDSHAALPTVSRPWRKIEEQDLVPYRKLLPDLPFIMVNHALYPEKNRRLPASLSPEIVRGFLLESWDYGGLSISDDLIMGAVSAKHTLTEAAEQAILAGNHMFLVCRPENVLQSYRELCRSAQENPVLQQTFLSNSARILAFKFRQVQPTPPRSSVRSDVAHLRTLSQDISERALTLLRGNPPAPFPSEATLFLPRTKWLRGGPSILAKTLSTKQRRLREHLYEIRMTESDGSVLAAQSRTEWNIVGVTSLARPGQHALLRSLLSSGKRVILIHGFFPGESLPRGVESALAVYWTSPAALEAAARWLLGALHPSGKLPL